MANLSKNFVSWRILLTSLVAITKSLLMTEAVLNILGDKKINNVLFTQEAYSWVKNNFFVDCYQMYDIAISLYSSQPSP